MNTPNTPEECQTYIDMIMVNIRLMMARPGLRPLTSSEMHQRADRIKTYETSQMLPLPEPKYFHKPGLWCDDHNRVH